MFLLPGTPKHVAEDLEKIEKRAALLKYNSKDLLGDLEKVLGKLKSGQGLGMVLSTNFHGFNIIVVNFLVFIDCLKSFCSSQKHCLNFPFREISRSLPVQSDSSRGFPRISRLRM